MAAFTLFHVAISLIGIMAGLITLFGLLKGALFKGWTRLFLITTIATSATGFLFPFHHVMPSHVIGLFSLLILALATYALYNKLLVGHWRTAFVISSALALYFNVFVLIAQSFQKIPALKVLAPTQSEPPFALAQLSLLIVFVILTIRAVKKFRGDQGFAA